MSCVDCELVRISNYPQTNVKKCLLVVVMIRLTKVGRHILNVRNRNPIPGLGWVLSCIVFIDASSSSSFSSSSLLSSPLLMSL